MSLLFPKGVLPLPGLVGPGRGLARFVPANGLLTRINAFRGSVVGGSGSGITYSNAPLGATIGTRVIYAVHSFFDGSSTSGPDTASVTIGGNAATLLGSVYLPSATTSGVGLWAYEDGGSLGATADVVVTDGTLRNSRSVGILTGQGSGISVLDTASEANLSGSIAGDTLNTAGADCLLYVCSTQNGADVSANAPFTDGGATYDENTDDWVTIGWSNDPSGNIESVNLPTGHTSLRAAYVGLALAS